MIKGLHHNAYRCRDSEETRKFYEDFLGLPLANAFEIKTTLTGRDTTAKQITAALLARNGITVISSEADLDRIDLSQE